MADLVPLRHGRLSTGHDCASSVEQQAWHTVCHTSLTQNNFTTEHFDMTSGDVDEMVEEFFPEDLHVIDCS